jgi:ubiquinone/menaquinone biosynthesis C-methylase UbiE
MCNFYDNLENKVFTMISKEAKGRKSIIDMGCGGCKLVFFLARELKDVRVVGIDLRNWEFPDVVEKRREEKIANQVECLKADASDLNFLKEKSFDLVVSVYSLHEFRAPEKVLKGTFRVLNEGEKVIIVDFIKDTLADKLWGERYYTPGKVINMIEEAGFQNISGQLLSKEGPGMFTAIKEESIQGAVFGEIDGPQHKD